MIALDILVKYAVSEKSEGDAWSELVMLCATYTKEEAEDVLKNAEAEFKEKTGESKSPSRYRSAKSVLLSAKGMNVATVGEDGLPIGKSAVEKGIRVLKSKEPESVLDCLDRCIAEMREKFKLVTDEGERVALQSHVEGTIPSIWGY